MTHPFITDTRGTSKVVATVLLVMVLAFSATIGGAYVTDQFREETSDSTEIAESTIDTPTHDQVHITPLVGDDLALETVTVRIEFLDRDAPPAVVTNLQAATDHSTSTEVTTTTTVQTAGEYEPVNRTVTTYEQNGTTDTVTFQTSKWQTERMVERHLYEYQHKQYHGVKDREFATADATPEKADHYTENAGKVIVWEYTDSSRDGSGDTVTKTWKGAAFEPWNGRPTVVNQTLAMETVHPVEWATTTETKTVTVEHPEKPGDGWQQVYTWEKPTEIERVSKYQYWGCYCPDHDERHWFERGDDDFEKYLDDDGEPLNDRSNVIYETVTVTKTVNSSTKPGPGWKQVYTWEQTKTPSTVQFAGEVDIDDDEVEVERDDDEREAEEREGGEGRVWDMDDLPDSFEPSPEQVVEYETVRTTRTTNAATKPGPGWERVGPAPTGTETYELDEPAPTYEQTTKAFTVGYNVTNTTSEVERERTLHVPAATASPASANATTVQGVLQNAPASTSVSFLDVDGANSAVGVGGTIGTTHHGQMAQGDTAVIQLDQPLLFDGERINVQLIDTQTNSLVMDRNVRVQTPEQFQFAPDGTTPPNGATPNGTGTVAVNDSLQPGNGLGDAPAIDPAPGNDTQPPDSDPDGPPDTSPDDGGSNSSPNVGTGDGDGKPQTTADLDCRFATRTASGGIACVGDQTSGNDDSATEGYITVCQTEGIECAEGDGGALPGDKDGDDDGGAGDNNPGNSNTNSGSESDDAGTGGSNYGGSDSGYAKLPM